MGNQSVKKFKNRNSSKEEHYPHAYVKTFLFRQSYTYTHDEIHMMIADENIHVRLSANDNNQSLKNENKCQISFIYSWAKKQKDRKTLK